MDPTDRKSRNTQDDNKRLRWRFLNFSQVGAVPIVLIVGVVFFLFVMNYVRSKGAEEEKKAEGEARMVVER